MVSTLSLHVRTEGASLLLGNSELLLQIENFEQGLTLEQVILSVKRVLSGSRNNPYLAIGVSPSGEENGLLWLKQGLASGQLHLLQVDSRGGRLYPLSLTIDELSAGYPIMTSASVAQFDQVAQLVASRIAGITATEVGGAAFPITEPGYVFATFVPEPYNF